VVLVATFAGSLSATAWAQATGPFNVRSYGASGALNCAADTTGFLNALAAIPASGGEVYVPAGNYCLNQSLLVSGKSIAFRGEGKKLSNIRWDAGANGIEYYAANSSQSLTVKSLSLIANNGISGTAIYGSWPAGAVTSTLSITDVAISHYSPVTWNSWSYGVRVANASNAVITDFDISGPSGYSGNQAAVRLEGQTLNANVAHGSVLFYKDGVQMVGTSEGLHADDLDLVGVLRGIVMDTQSSLPGTSISNCHIAAVDKGIYLWRRGDVAISGNLLYTTVASSNYMGIHAVHSDSLRITGNYIVRTSPTGNYNGIVIDGTSPRLVISNNITEGMDTGIWIVGPGITQSVITSNINRLFVYNAILDGSTPGSNLFANNF
jgi:hypothetical protein